TQGGGARRMRMGGGGGGGGGGGSGLTNTGSIGLNYRKSFMDEKLSTYGSYSYSQNDNNTLSTSLNQYIYPDSLILNQNNTSSESLGNNHRLDWNVEYKIDDDNYFKLSPSFSMSDSETSSLQNSPFITHDNLTSAVERNNSNQSSSPNVRLSGLFNHRFNERGRTVFVDFSLGNSSTESDRDEIVAPYDYGASDETEFRRQLIDLRNK